MYMREIHAEKNPQFNNCVDPCFRLPHAISSEDPRFPLLGNHRRCFAVPWPRQLKSILDQQIELPGAAILIWGTGHTQMDLNLEKSKLSDSLI